MRRTLLVVANVVLLAGCKTKPAATPAPTAAPEPEPVATTAPTSQSPANDAVVCKDCIPVNVDNFVRAESDRTFAGIAQQGGLGKFEHFRAAVPIDKQVAPRGNMDTLYSLAVWDLDAGPVTITLPGSGKRFETMMVIDEDHYVRGLYYGEGSYTVTKQSVGTRYGLTAVRVFADPDDPNDLKTVHALQDAIRAQQKGVAGTLQFPKWDEASQTKTREALTELRAQLPDLRHAYGSKGEVDPVRHLIATATAYGGSPDKDAIYLTVVPERNDSLTIQRLAVSKVPVDGFWSVTVYDSKGYLEPNRFDSYSVNSVTAKKGTDGLVTVQFGGCDGKVPNCLPTTAGWNYMVRLYRPRPEILNGKWKFPQARPKQGTVGESTDR